MSPANRRRNAAAGDGAGGQGAAAPPARRRKWLPSVPLSLLLFLLWLLLNDSASPGHIAVAAVLAVVGPVAAARLRPLQSNPRPAWAVVRLAFSVAVDVVRSNFAVARIVVGGRGAMLTSGFICVPLDLRDPHALAILACVLTITPGTVWSGLDESTGILTLHILDLRDEGEWVRFIKARYEQPLKEIFES